MTPHQIWLKELAEDAEQLRELLGVYLKMRHNPEMAEFKDRLTDIIQQIMTLLHMEREVLIREN